MGFTGMVLGAMLHRDGLAATTSPTVWTPPDGKPQFPPKAKSVIWIFMLGGVSHLESFDPKPEVNKYAGKTIEETPHKDKLNSPFVKQNVREAVAGLHKVQKKLFPMQIGYAKHGQSGIEVSDWWPRLSEVIDDVCVVRSMWTTDNDHGAQIQFNCGRHMFEGIFPSIGSWVHYGLGSMNENLPEFVVLGNTMGNNLELSHGASYLGPEHAGVRLEVNPQNPLPFASPVSDVFREEQEGEFGLLKDLNQIAAVEYPHDAAMRARIKSYELAFHMQTAVPEIFHFDEEKEPTRKLYGLDQDVTRPFGQSCLAARRLVERGVRFVQLYHGGQSGNEWDAHQKLKENHGSLCPKVDQPIAGLIKDLKQRGMLDETLVVWATEFGRTPGAEGGSGRDHHPFGFSVWLAGGGIKGGMVHGATDELGFHAVENRHYVTDIHATVLHQLGLDSRRLNYPGQKRLEIDYGSVIKDILV
jgi:hypothetical protein